MSIKCLVSRPGLLGSSLSVSGDLERLNALIYTLYSSVLTEFLLSLILFSFEFPLSQTFSKSPIYVQRSSHD